MLRITTVFGVNTFNYIEIKNFGIMVFQHILNLAICNNIILEFNKPTSIWSNLTIMIPDKKLVFLVLA